jgi:hypothetical protein
VKNDNFVRKVYYTVLLDNEFKTLDVGFVCGFSWNLN